MLDTSQNSELPPAAKKFDSNNLNGLPPVSNKNNNNNINNNDDNNNLNDIKKGQPKRNFNHPGGNNPNLNDPDHKYEVVEFMKPNGFFVFQTMLEFHYIFTIIYFLATIALFVYKIHFFHFPPSSCSVEICSLVFYFFIQLARFYLGDLGNRTEQSIFLLFNLIFGVGILFTYVYFLVLQTFVLRIEFILNLVGIVIAVFEMVPCVLSFLAVSKQESQI